MIYPFQERYGSCDVEQIWSRWRMQRVKANECATPVMSTCRMTCRTVQAP